MSKRSKIVSACRFFADLKLAIAVFLLVSSVLDGIAMDPHRLILVGMLNSTCACVHILVCVCVCVCVCVSCSCSGSMLALAPDLALAGFCFPILFFVFPLALALPLLFFFPSLSYERCSKT